MGKMIPSALKLLATHILRHLPRSILLLLANVSWRQNQNDARSIQRIPSQRTFIDKIPPNSWDSHMHVVDPSKYPLAADAQYTPKPHILSEALRYESTVGIHNLVLVQPSIYGNDNTCMLDALRQLGPQCGRAVVAFDPKTISASTLEEWHKIGVRGVRINLQSVGKSMSSNELSATLHQHADIIRPFDWILELYVPIATTAALEKIVPELRVKVCFDHFGQPVLPSPSKKTQYSLSGDPYLLPGFQSLINLLAQGDTYVKMSAPYRISIEAGQRDLEPVAKELLRVAGKTRVLFATDWPHTRFEGLDIRPFMEQVVEWCGEDEVLIEKVFKSNAEDLWGVNR
jgi:predicted TIM-barrel fold metal-dependent hydrolase